MGVMGDDNVRCAFSFLDLQHILLSASVVCWPKARV